TSRSPAKSFSSESAAERGFNESVLISDGRVETMILRRADAWALFAARRSFSAVLKEMMLRRSQVRRSREAREARMAKVRLNFKREIIVQVRGTRHEARGSGLILVPSSSLPVP